jgi:hypothetical protein
VVVCFGRTGSGWLCSLLQSHPAILCHGEIFSAKGLRLAGPPRERSAIAARWPVSSRDTDPMGFVQDVLAEGLGHQAVGFKMLNWMHPEVLFGLARSPDVHKVILGRRNRVRAFLSRTRSEALERWWDEGYDGFRVRLDPTELVEYAGRYEDFYDQLRVAAAGTPALEVTYEDLLEDEQRAREIVDFLGVRPSDIQLESRWPRQSRDQTRDVVSNFDELSVLLRGTGLEAELEA